MATIDRGLPSAGVIKYASFTRRLCAWCIDTPIMFSVGLALVFLPMRLMVSDQMKQYGSTNPTYIWNVMSSTERGAIFVLWVFASVIVPWLYAALQECSGVQATFGKKPLKLTVTDLAGRRISFRRASGRFFGKLIPTLGLGYCMVLFTRRRQALHDLVAGCVIVQRVSKTQ